MGLNRQPTPELVDRLLQEVEFPLRAIKIPTTMVEEVLRFGHHVASRIEWHPNLGRGMDRARSEIVALERQGLSYPSGTVILAGSLSDGKGRFARVWHAPPGGVWLTLVLANTFLPRYANFLSLAGGVSCAEALSTIGVDCRLKWVNDVHVGGRKIAGILTESFRSPKHGEEYILLGIGINVNNDVFPPELASSSVSACQLLAAPIALNDFISLLLTKLAWNIGLLHYEERQDLAEGEGARSNLLLNRWKALSDTVGKRVLYGFDVQKKPLFEATVLDVDAEGGLVMRLYGAERIVREMSGEIVYLS